ncbi:MAG: HutD family protein [Methylobacterium sp.]
MRILKAERHRRMPWKNGGGETIEIAVHPPGAGLSGFDWRISMASVVADGPFSRFEGIDRTLAILAGRGMDLEIDGMGQQSLTAGSAPLAFPADAPTHARLHDGAITDLNVMTRRGVCAHRVSFVPSLGARIELGGRWGFVIPLAPCRVAMDATEVEVEAGDAIALTAPALSLRLSSSTPVAAYVVEIHD